MVKFYILVCYFLFVMLKRKIFNVYLLDELYILLNEEDEEKGEFYFWRKLGSQITM